MQPSMFHRATRLPATSYYPSRLFHDSPTRCIQQLSSTPRLFSCKPRCALVTRRLDPYAPLLSCRSGEFNLLFHSRRTPPAGAETEYFTGNSPFQPAFTKTSPPPSGRELGSDCVVRNPTGAWKI